MTNLLKIPMEKIGELHFEIKHLECVDSNYEYFSEIVGVDPETDETYESTFYQRDAWGTVSYTAEFEGEKLELSFYWSADASSKKTYKESFDFDVNFAEDLNEEKNFIFIDEDGDECSYSLDEIESEAGGFEDFRSGARQELPYIEDNEILKEKRLVTLYEPEDLVLERDDGVDLEFKGVVLVYTTDKDPYNDRGRWKDFTLYQSIGGKYICQKEEITRWQGERDSSKIMVCNTIEEIKEFFGNNSLSEDIYFKMGMDSNLDSKPVR